MNSQINVDFLRYVSRMRLFSEIMIMMVTVAKFSR